jgi:hypothetical protein
MNSGSTPSMGIVPLRIAEVCGCSATAILSFTLADTTLPLANGQKLTLERELPARQRVELNTLRT